MLTYQILLVVFIFKAAVTLETSDDFSVIHITQNVVEDVKFPEVLHVEFDYYGKAVSLKFSRDVETTQQLSEAVFDISSFLPSGLFNNENAGDFSAYTSDGATVVAHRENTTVLCKLYGRFMLDDDRMVMTSEDGSHFLHRVVPEADLKSRQRREVSSNDTDEKNTIELTLFTDFSVYDFWSSSVMASSRKEDITREMRDWLSSLTRDTDTVFHKISDYSSMNVRVYLQNAQIATKETDQTPWTKDTLDPESNIIKAKLALKNLADHYQNLVDTFDYPETDHLMVLTRYNLHSGKQLATVNTLCGSKRSMSYVNTKYFIKPMAQALAESMGVAMDGTQASPCEEDDCYVMSLNYGPISDEKHENPWKFSLCSALDIKEFLEKPESSCLRETNARFDFDIFMTVLPFGLRYTTDQQCQTNFGAASKYCRINGKDEETGRSNCYNEREGCLVNGVCENYQFGDFTPCDKGVACRFGTCERAISPPGYGYKTTTFMPSSSIGSSSVMTSVMSSSSQATSTTTPDGNPQTSTTSMTTKFGGFKPTNVTTTSSTTSTTESSTTSTTTDRNLQSSTTTSVDSCVVDFGFEEVTLPGCGCCGGCGCDVTCDSCADGLGRPAYSLNPDVCNATANCCQPKIRIHTMFIPEGCNVAVTPDNMTLVIEKRGWEVTDLNVNAVAKPMPDGSWSVAFE